MNADLTLGSHQGLGPAAAEAVQQAPGSDVVVEESNRTPDLHQTQPEPHKHRLIPEEQRGRVALLQSALQERSRSLVAELVRVPVGERLISEEEERLVRLQLHQVREPVLDEVISPDVFPGEARCVQLH